MNEFLLPSVGGANPNPVAYQDFVDYVASHTVQTKTATQTLDGTNQQNYVRIDLTSTGTESAYGSAWGRAAWWGTPMYRLVQHMLPDLASWNDYVKNKRVAMFKLGTSVSGKNVMSGVSHNDFTSSSYAGQTSGWYIKDIIYWDDATQQVKRCSPQSTESGKPFNGILL